MNYANIKEHDIANGEGVRTSLFVSGCRLHCKECFNQEAWDFKAGKAFDETVEEKIIESLSPYYISGLSVLGGEPMEEENQEVLYSFLGKVKTSYPKKKIWLFTGYRLDQELAEDGRKYTPYTSKILESVDILVDGPFMASKKDMGLRFRGSANQRVIDMVKTRQSKGQIILYLE